MTGLQWRTGFAVSMMLAGAALAYVGRPTLHLADQIGKPDLEALFPKSFSGWRLNANLPVILPAPDVQAKLDKIYNQVLSRTYVNAKEQVIMLSVAYGGDQSDGTSAHRPEVCYPAQGFAITSNQRGSQPVPGGSMPVRRLMSSLGTRDEPLTYWVVVGNEVATTGIEQKLAQMRYGMHGVIADGMLVRVSSIDTNMAAAHAVQSAFIAELAEAIPKTARSRVFGEQAP